MKINLKAALNNPIWLTHKIGDIYKMDNNGAWKIVYYPLLGTWQNKYDEQGLTILEKWVDFEEPRALIEQKAIFNGVEGTDFREVPLRYLNRMTNIPQNQG